MNVKIHSSYPIPTNSKNSYVHTVIPLVDLNSLIMSEDNEKNLAEYFSEEM